MLFTFKTIGFAPKIITFRLSKNTFTATEQHKTLTDNALHFTCHFILFLKANTKNSEHGKSECVKIKKFSK